jgi:hypothetical protein
MRIFTNEELQAILEKHKKWLNKEEGGERADLAGASLSNADLSGADLTWANLAGANLAWANLAGANLTVADLSGSKLTGANLTGANLAGADMSRTNLIGTDLFSANLTNAILDCTDLQSAFLNHACIDDDTINRYFPLACPSEGSFIGWKKVRGGMIVKLLIPKDAKRSSSFGRKCRCNKAVVLSIEYIDGTPAKENYVAYSIADPNFTYRVGETVSVSNFRKDRTKECAPGIHFFITREEAVKYGV